jgi:hypothetical protein
MSKVITLIFVNVGVVDVVDIMVKAWVAFVYVNEQAILVI